MMQLTQLSDNEIVKRLYTLNKEAETFCTRFRYPREIGDIFFDTIPQSNDLTKEEREKLPSRDEMISRIQKLEIYFQILEIGLVMKKLHQDMFDEDEKYFKDRIKEDPAISDDDWLNSQFADSWAKYYRRRIVKEKTIYLENGCYRPSTISMDDAKWPRGGLHHFPSVILKFTSVERLYLSNHMLNEIPAEIAHLKKLKSLHLSGNKLQSLPESIDSLNSLTWLDVSHNKLKELPSSIVALSSLRRLSLSHNGLKSLPEKMGNLESLEFLEMDNNKLTELQTSIGNLTNLRCLELSHNRIKSLPKETGNLIFLKLLKVEDNKLKKFPVSIAKLENLWQLYAGNNRLNSIPSNIGNLKSLEILKLSQNNLQELPKSVGKLTSLIYLIVDGNPLRSVPKLNKKCGGLTLNIKNTPIVLKRGEKEKLEKTIRRLQFNGTVKD